MRNEELAAPCVRACQRHPHRTAGVAQTVDLIANDVSWTALTIASGIAILQYEVWHHPMPTAVVEVPVFGQSHEIQHRERRFLRVQFQHDLPAGSGDTHARAYARAVR